MTPIGPIELLPCPFCAGTSELPKSFEWLGFNEDCDEFAILCRHCGAIGPYISGHEWDTEDESNFPQVLAECVEAWNRRAPQPSQDKEPRKWKPDEKFKADYADFGRGQVPAVFFPGSSENFLVTSEDQAKLVARLLNEWLAKSALNASEERDLKAALVRCVTAGQVFWDAWKEESGCFGCEGEYEPGEGIQHDPGCWAEMILNATMDAREMLASADAAKEKKK